MEWEELFPMVEITENQYLLYGNCGGMDDP